MGASAGRGRDFLSRVCSTICRHSLFEGGDAVLVGVSGGADSVALVHALSALAGRMRLSLGVAHVHHGLRGPEADADAVFVENLAAGLGLPFFLTRADVRAMAAQGRVSLEEAGREARYAFFERLCDAGPFTRIAVAHHANDNAECVLMHVLRGAGPGGVAGIPPKNGRVARPFIEVFRPDIEAFLKDSGLCWREDRSNQDPSFARNKIRHELLPLLAREYNPRIAEALNRLAALQRQEESFWEGLVPGCLKACSAQKTPEGLWLSSGAVAGLGPAVARRVVREAVLREKGDVRRIAAAHVEAVLGLCAKGAGQVHLPGGIVCRAGGGRLLVENRGDPSFRKHVAVKEPCPEVHLQIPGPGSFLVPGRGMRVDFSTGAPGSLGTLVSPDRETAFFDLDAVEFPMNLRAVRPGDRFTPLGAPGSRKVKRFLKDRKAPKDQRRDALVLESRGRIIWLVGHRISEHAKVTEKTRQVLAAKLSLA